MRGEAHATPRHALLALLGALCLLPALALAWLSPAVARAAAVEKVTDPDTSGLWAEGLDEAGPAGGVRLSTEAAGRIWVDKSVYGSSEDAGAAGLPVGLDDERRGFLVSLSALSSAASVRPETVAPHDVVLVVSTSGTLGTMTYGGRPQAAWLADALDAAIARLMALNEGSADTVRVGVIGYAAEVTTLMSLGTWEPGDDGRYVTYDPDARALRVSATGGGQTSGAALGSGSYLQRAVHEAGALLEREPRTGATPVLVVMGTDNPPMASADYLDPPTYGDPAGGDLLGPLPGSGTSGYGTDALLATLLTLRDVDLGVSAAYGGDLRVMTVGLDTSGTMGYLLGTASEQAAQELPGTGEAAGTDLRANLIAAVDALRDAAERSEKDVALELWGSGSGGLVAETVSFPVDAALVDGADGAALGVVDDYLPAHSAATLTWAFGTAVDRTTGVNYEAPASGGPDEELPGGSRVTVRDQIGPGMRVTRVDGLVYGTTAPSEARLLDGSLAARALTQSVRDPWDLEATHEFAYLVDALNARYDLGSEAYDLFYEAYADGQFVYHGDTDFSNRASWYVTAGHEMVPSAGRAYTFASQAEVDAVTARTWRDDPAVSARVEAARSAGATALCETYFYIGSLADQYSGGDVALYDFVVMVETDLETGHQTLLLSMPVEAVPARHAVVTLDADGTATMALDGAAVRPASLVYEVAPVPVVDALIDRAEAGALVSDEELERALGAEPGRGGLGRRLLYAGAYPDADEAGEATTVAGAWAARSNPAYVFSRDTPLLTLRAGASLADGALPTPDQLEPLTTLPEPGTTYYFTRTAYTATLPSPDAIAPAQATSIVTPYVTVAGTGRFSLEDGRCVALAGTPRLVLPAEAGSREKDPNSTDSAPYVERLSVDEEASGGVRLSARLGNNGALVLPPATGTGELVVEKRVEGAATGSFAFIVTLRDGSGEPLTGTVTWHVGDRTGSAELVDGSFSAELSDGDELAVDGLPRGTAYEVVERDYAPGGYLTLREGATGAIGETPARARFTNVWCPGALGIGVVVISDDAADRDRTFSYEVRVSGLFSTHPDTDELALDATRHDIDGVLGTERLTFRRADGTDDGVATVTSLADGQGLLVEGLPSGASYEVRALDAEALLAEGWRMWAGSAEEVAAGARPTRRREPWAAGTRRARRTS